MINKTMAVVNKFNVNKQEVRLDADIIENMSANDVSYDDSFQYDENTVGNKLSELSQQGQQMIYDVTTNNNGATFDSLSALLSSENLSTLIPSTVRCGGMSIRFVQSSDNKYVQYRLNSKTWSVNINDWNGIENNLVAYLKDLTKSSQKINWLSSKYYYSDGSLKDSDSRLSAVKCDIVEGITEIITNIVTIDNNYGGVIVFFNSSDEVISYIINKVVRDWKFSVPNGTKSIGFTNAVLNIQPNPYILGVKGTRIIDLITDLQIETQNIYTEVRQKLDTAWLNGGHISKQYTKDDCIYNDGVISNRGDIFASSSGDWRHSDYLPIEYSNGTFILTDNLVSGPGWGMAFYDKNRQFCGYQGFNKDENLSVAIPTNAKYFRFSHNNPKSGIINIFVSYDVVFNDSLQGQLRHLDTDEISVYGLGDSTNSDDAQRGVGTPYDNVHFSATKVIAKRLNASTYVNYSVPGTNTAYAYTKSQLIPDTATIVVIVVGINDLNHGDTIGDIDTILAIENVDEIPEDTILGIYVKMVKKLRARLAKNAQIVCVSPYFYSSTTIRSDLITLREGIRKMCWPIGQRKGMRFIDGCNVGINPSNYGILCRDITHPMMEGQTVIASHIMEHITPPSIAAEQYDLPEVLDNGLKMVVTPYQPLVS